MLFSSYCLKKNFFVFFGSKKSVLRAVNKFSPGIYFHKSINYSDFDFIKKIKAKKNFYVSLDEEGGFAFSTKNDLNNFLNYRSSQKNMELVDKIFTWGVFDENIWKKKYPNYKKKIINFGAPRVDLWKEKNVKKVFSNEIQDINKRYKDFILILSSGLTSKRELNKVLSFDSKWLNLKNYIQKKKRLKMLKNDLKLFKMFLQTIFNVCKSNPKIKFVLKPHPTESKEDWKKISKKFPKNLLFEEDIETSPLIYCAQGILQTSSSTAVQSYLLNKNVISYRPKKMYFERNFGNYFGKIVTNSNQMNKSIKKLTKFGVKKNFLDKKINSRLSFVKSEDNSKRIADYLFKFTPINNKINFTKIYFYSFVFKISDILSPIFRFNIKRTNYANRSYKEKMNNGISKKEIKNFFAKVSLSKTKVIKICKDGYYFKN